MLASVILDKVRFKLSDSDSSVWSDARLISLLNDVLLELSLETRLFTTSSLVRLIEGVANYDISNIASKIERVEFQNRVLPMVSMRELDRSDYRDYDRDSRSRHYYSRDFAGFLPSELYSRDWQDREGSRPRAIVYDQNRAGIFTVYPIPKGLDEGAGSQTVANQLEGVITGITLEGLGLDVIEGTLPLNSSENINNFIEIFYTKKPTIINSPMDEVDEVVSSQVANVIQFYITGHAFRDNMQEQNNALGLEDLQLYNIGKESLIGEKSVGNVSRVRKTDYRPFD